MWQKFAEHAPVVLATAVTGAALAGYRGCNALFRSRRRPKTLRLIVYSANSSLSGAFGSALIAAGMVHLAPSWPWLVLFLGATGGVAADVARANGLHRLRSLWLDYLARVQELRNGRR